MAMLISYKAARAFQAVVFASWMALTTVSPATAADFDDGFTAYLRGNFNGAFNIWLPLAEYGGIEAQFGLGLLYESGRGVQRDLATAASWFTRAAEQGSKRAQTQLGGMYARGDGVAEDWNQAIAWWLRAAAQGSMRAQFHLGQAYQFGSGVELDLASALKWYDQAAVQGYQPAARQIAEIQRLRDQEEKADQPKGPESVVLDLEISKPPSGFHETAADLQAHDAMAVIALGEASSRPLDGSHRIYLSSYRGIQKASDGWRDMTDANPVLLGALDAAVAQVDLGRNKGILYRLQAGPLPDLTAANALCYKLGQLDIPCAVVTP